MEKIALPALLDRFSVKELSEALFQADLPEIGNKAERIDRLFADTTARTA